MNDVIIRKSGFFRWLFGECETIRIKGEDIRYIQCGPYCSSGAGPWCIVEKTDGTIIEGEKYEPHELFYGSF